MDRRAFLEASGTAVAGLALGGCAGRVTAAPAITVSARRASNLVVPDIAWDRIIRTTVGLRPHRDSGFVVRADRLDDRTVIHNYGHGGAGWSLSWGTATLAADLAVDHPDRRAAVIGCGAVGLTAARILQRRGFTVTIYAAELPPNTTSNMSWAAFTPVSGLFSPSRRTAAWDAQFQRAVRIAYREHQLLAGTHYGVSWIDEYAVRNGPVPAAALSVGGSVTAGDPQDAPLLPADARVGGILLASGSHPWGDRPVIQRPALRFEPSVYLTELMRDFVAFGGRIVVRKFDTPRDFASLEERLIVNCTGLGARSLFGDEELIPEKGQLVFMVPQPEINYTVAGMMPRADGLALGHVSIRGDWSLEPNEDRKKQVVDAAIAFFGAMRGAPAPAPVTPPSRGASPPPVEAFFDRVS